MKKINFKNCIAFTLVEMTLVLLITSIIAAAATPMLTSAINGSDGNKDVDVAATYDTPWKAASSYNGGGIYNSPHNRNSIIAIGYKTGAYAASYGYPSLLVHQNSVNNFVHAPQIKIIHTNANSPAGSYTNIAMDEFQNMSVTYGSSFQAIKNLNSNSFMGLSNIFMGSYINPTLPGGNYRSSTFMGYGIDVLYAQNSFVIGSNIYANNLLKNSVLIGSNLKPENNTNVTYSNVVGYYAGNNANLDNDIYLGSYAGYRNKAKKNIMIGNNAGRNFFSVAGFNEASENSIIGNYAGFVSNLSKNFQNASMYGNNYVGKYAGSTINRSVTIAENSRNLVARNNLAIGNYAGLYDFGTNSILIQDNNVYIGNYAGYTKITKAANSNIVATRRICIGQNSCSNENVKAYEPGEITAADINSPYSNVSYDDVYIGYGAGKENGGVGYNIGIGNYAGSQTHSDFHTKYAIAIGSEAGYAAHSMYSIFIGNRAGYGSINHNSFFNFVGSSDATTRKRLANLAIGNDTCKGITVGGKSCIGSGTLENPLGYIDDELELGMIVWDKNNPGSQMVIGFVDKGIKNQSIIFYAGHVIKGGSITSGDLQVPVGSSNYQLSDRRYKKDIVPSLHSIEDIRKINIYDYNYKKDKDKKTVTGIIAQEYRKIFPNDVTVEPTSKKLSASSDWLLYTLVNAVKAVDKEIIDLEKDVKIYIKDFMGLKEKVANLEKQAEKIKTENEQLKKHLANINSKLK